MHALMPAHLSLAVLLMLLAASFTASTSPLQKHRKVSLQLRTLSKQQAPLVLQQTSSRVAETCSLKTVGAGEAGRVASNAVLLLTCQSCLQNLYWKQHCRHQHHCWCPCNTQLKAVACMWQLWCAAQKGQSVASGFAHSVQ